MLTLIRSLMTFLAGLLSSRLKPRSPSGYSDSLPASSLPSPLPLPPSYSATTAPSVADAVLAVAKSQLGVEEHPRGSNSGPEVDQYLAFVHTRPGQPWCAAAVSWCCNKGGATQMRYSASAMRLLELNASLRLLGPQPGCVGIVDHGQGKGHAFFVVAVTPGGLITYEPNSNPDGGREGYIFCKRLRAQGTVTGGYLRIA
jgi:hypothetical protein